MKTLKLFLVLLLLVPVNLTGQKLVLDESFGDKGFIIIPDVKIYYRMFMDDVGNTYILGGSEDNEKYYFHIAKVKPDGFVDESFGNKGISTEEVKNKNPQAKGRGYYISHFILPDNKILIGVNSPGIRPNGIGTVYFNLLRYNPDGTLDSTFGDNGIVSFDHDFNYDGEARVYAGLSDQSILVGGRFWDIGTPVEETGVHVIKLKEDGTMDDEFDKLVFSPRFVAHEIYFLSDHTILYVGASDGYAGFEKYLEFHKTDWNGNLVSDFGDNGRKVYLKDSYKTHKGKMIERENGELWYLPIGGDFLLKISSMGEIKEHIDIFYLNTQLQYRTDIRLTSSGQVVYCGGRSLDGQYYYAGLKGTEGIDFVYHSDFGFEAYPREIFFLDDTRFWGTGIITEKGVDKRILFRAKVDMGTAIPETTAGLLISSDVSGLRIKSHSEPISSLTITGLDGRLLLSKNYSGEPEVLVTDFSCSGIVILKVVLTSGEVINYKCKI